MVVRIFVKDYETSFIDHIVVTGMVIYFLLATLKTKPLMMNPQWDSCIDMTGKIFVPLRGLYRLGC